MAGNGLPAHGLCFFQHAADGPWHLSSASFYRECQFMSGFAAHPRAAPFTPTPWLANRHVQTLMAAVMRAPQVSLTSESIELPDGDVIDLVRTGPAAGRPAVVLLHGLEGSVRSSYARAMLAAWHGRGWCGVLVHARGSAQRPNRLARGYHSGDWQDAALVVARLQTEGATAIAGVGVSLGGNVLLKWLGETGEACPLRAAVAISVPFDLAACADALSHGFARFYQWHLLRDMRASVWAKRALNGATRRQLRRLTTFRAFDDCFTAPQNGFADVADYYAQCSCRRFLASIVTPTTIIQAADDPFVPPASLPDALPSAVRLHLSPQGGHVGFLHGTWPRSWLPEAVTSALMEHL